MPFLWVSSAFLGIAEIRTNYLSNILRFNLEYATTLKPVMKDSRRKKKIGSEENYAFGIMYIGTRYATDGISTQEQGTVPYWLAPYSIVKEEKVRY